LSDPMRTVVLREDLCHAAEQKFAYRYGGLEGLLTAALEELVRDDALKMDQKELQIIEERLKGLGYI
jgi:hypothetical protein